MIEEPCGSVIGYWNLSKDKIEAGKSPQVESLHDWGAWESQQGIKEEKLVVGNMQYTVWQKRWCNRCGLEQQRRVTV